MPVHAEEVELSDEQRNAIAMLNYITVLTQDINASKNSRLYMEEAYSLLINNTYPNAVDSRTQSQLTSLLDIMESYRMIDVKRERLQYIYEQNQAQAIRAAMPNPLALMSAMQAFRPEKLAAAIVYMAVDSISSYTAYTKETDLQYLKDGWALDDDEAEVLHSSRKGTFSYMISMVRDNDLPGDLTLTENAVEELIEWKNNDNTVGRIRFLESNQNTYQSYGGYWLILAESYYANGNYAKSLDALASYEGLEARIFRRDYELAKILPLMISAAEKIYSIHKYTDHFHDPERCLHLQSNTPYLLSRSGENTPWHHFKGQQTHSLFRKHSLAVLRLQHVKLPGGHIQDRRTTFASIWRKVEMQCHPSAFPIKSRNIQKTQLDIQRDFLLDAIRYAFTAQHMIIEIIVSIAIIGKVPVHVFCRHEPRLFQISGKKLPRPGFTVI